MGVEGARQQNSGSFGKGRGGRRDELDWELELGGLCPTVAIPDPPAASEGRGECQKASFFPETAAIFLGHPFSRLPLWYPGVSL